MITLSITSAGIPWSTADLARITPDPEAPLCSVQQQLEALGYRVTAIQGLGMEVSAEVEADVTDEQIRDYVREHWRDAWIGGGPGKGIVNDAAIIMFSSTTPREWKLRIRSEFARLIDAAMAKAALEHNLRGGRS